MLDLKELSAELENFIIDEEAAELDIEIKEGFKITSFEQAIFFMKRAADAQKELDEIEAYCKDEIAKFTERINTFKESKTTTLNNVVTFNSSLLEEYAKEALVGSKKKSIDTPFGTMQFRTSKEKYEYDDKKILSLVELNGINELIREKKELNKADFSKLISTDKNGVTKVTVGDKVLDITSLVTKVLAQEKFSLKIKL